MFRSARRDLHGLVALLGLATKRTTFFGRGSGLYCLSHAPRKTIKVFNVEFISLGLRLAFVFVIFFNYV